MTHDEMIEVIQHHKNGGRLQYRPFNAKYGGWQDCAGIPCWSFNTDDYRPKPEPEKVELGPEDVPPGSVLRHKRWGGGKWSAVLQVTEDGMIVFPRPDYENGISIQPILLPYSVAFADNDIQRPGEHWQPCWKEVEEE